MNASPEAGSGADAAPRGVRVDLFLRGGAILYLRFAPADVEPILTEIKALITKAVREQSIEAINLASGDFVIVNEVIAIRVTR